MVLITGGNSGIGREAAASLAAMGARVVITARDPGRGQDALRYVRERSGSKDVELRILDLSSFESIRSFAEGWISGEPALHVLINNAGAVLSDRRETAEGFEMTFGVNHLGHFLLTSLLLEALVASAPARIVNVSSIAHRFSRGMPFSDLQYQRRYAAQTAYGDSKLANVLFTRELARRLEGTGVVVNCCHPGPVRTGFGSAEDTSGLYRLTMVVARPFLIGARRGAVPLVHLAASPEAELISGAYFSRWPYSGLPGARVRPHRPSRRARDDAQALRLWEESERLVSSAS